MKCSEAQKIIITDFSDHEAAQELREAINRHLSGCQACRGFEAAVRTRLIEPLEKVVLKAPADLWVGIQERVLLQPEPAKWYGVFFPGAISVPRFALAAGLILMLAGVAKVGYQKKTAWQKEAAVCVMENMNYMESLSNNDETNENGETEELI
jgi:hypothetical protein